MHDNSFRQLSKFHEPGEFARLVEESRAGMTREDIYRKPENQPLKDAWQGAMFALGYQEYRHQLVEVRICVPEQFPDFQVRIAEQTFDFEATMIMRRGRRMGDEFRYDKTPGPVRREKPEALPPFDTEELSEAIAKKAGKHYGSEPHLAIYLNTQGRDVQLADLAAAARDPHGDKFASIWFVTDHYVGCGKPCLELPAPGGWFRIPIE